MTAPKIVVRNNPAARSYDAFVGEELAGTSVYELAPGRIIFTYTVLEPAYDTADVGDVLARDALDDARAQGLTVTPICPVVVDYLRQHDEYADLIDPTHRGAF